MGGSAEIISDIFEAFDRQGAAHYGENVTQLEHALQCAQLARDHNCSSALILAALLHDIGRMLEPNGNEIELRGSDAKHEQAGADALAPFYPHELTEPIRLHVAAKRYLCATDPEYLERLSDASKLSLSVQGGPMSSEEVAAFERLPFFKDATLLRRFDDWGKRTGTEVAELRSYLPLLHSLCTTG